jgi:hypothetical protein
MTPDELDALAKRLVACKHFTPMRGMRDLQGRTWDAALLWRWNSTIDRPDLTDPATLGCLLALVREAWGDPGMFVRPRGSKMRPDWALFTGANSDLVCAALSEAEALVAALERAG